MLRRCTREGETHNEALNVTVGNAHSPHQTEDFRVDGYASDELITPPCSMNHLDHAMMPR